MGKTKLVATHPVDKHVGRKLRDRRNELGYSQEQLASHVGLTFQQIQKYEKGQNRISCSKLYDFANFLKVEVSHFFRGIANSYNYENDNVLEEIAALADSASGAYEGDDQVKILINAFNSIHDFEVRQSIIRLTKSIIKLES